MGGAPQLSFPRAIPQGDLCRCRIKLEHQIYVQRWLRTCPRQGKVAGGLSSFVRIKRTLVVVSLSYSGMTLAESRYLTTFSTRSVTSSGPGIPVPKSLPRI